jgi:hypothetical protein
MRMVSNPQMIGQGDPPGAEDANGTTQAQATATPVTDASDPAPRPDPTRYGDWERNGRCIDF